ncbi:Uncharacterised protein [Mycolicibacterium vanbaalenii]|uniref:Uncharacterized protein n=1 Tax=Mycolicibacterium vanbaalenii TaxID=110539 RepID=A0A5S9R5L4_MYCVN|nr:hypothetical protein [Mycolicibacterium vanbaalenii]CAA0130397.1 Uncharacterised protein [Mycolicibacterium vanbaalenii]
MAALWNYTARVIVDAPAQTVATRIPSGIWAVEPIDPETSTLDAGPQSPELLAAYLGAMDLDFHVDTDAHPNSPPPQRHSPPATQQRRVSLLDP